MENDHGSISLYETSVTSLRQLQRRTVRALDSQLQASRFIGFREHREHPSPSRKVPASHFTAGHSQWDADKFLSIPQSVKRVRSLIHMHADTGRLISKSHTQDRGPG
jgi:hypothetical protein